jgi:midasin
VDQLDKLKENVLKDQGGRFEWIDSILVQALQNGYWLLIDNVNFCRYFTGYLQLHFLCFAFSASVLDRLNGLLEPQGVLSINERGVIDGQVPCIEPHPDFR